MLKRILTMGKQVRTQISQAKRAFEDRDVEMARDLVRQDDVVDNLNSECFQIALEIGDDHDRREWAMTMMLAARALERIGDNAVDIGEQVAFVVTGLFREFEDASHPGESSPDRPAPCRASVTAVVRLERAASARLRHDSPTMLCAAIDIGSNTTRVLVAEPSDGQLRKVMEQRAYTRIGKASKQDGAIEQPRRSHEVAEVVATQVRLAEELGAEVIKTGGHGGDPRGRQPRRGRCTRSPRWPGVEVEVLSEEEEGRLAFIGATKALGHPVEGKVGVVDVGGGSREVILGTVADGRRAGSLLQDRLRGRSPRSSSESDPPSAAEIREVRDHIDDFFEGVEIEQPEQAVAVGGSATSLRRLVGAVLEYETLERAVRVLAGDPIDEVAQALRARPAAGARSCPPGSCCSRRSRSCWASRFRSARAACARASSSTCLQRRAATDPRPKPWPPEPARLRALAERRLRLMAKATRDRGPRLRGAVRRGRCAGSSRRAPRS